MFSFTHSSNPFPSFPSSSSYSYPPLPFYIDPENGFAFASNTLLHDPLAVLPFMPSQAPTPETITNLSVADCTAMFQKDAINDAAHYGSSISKFLTKKPAKKDRHSKIHTSQGLRDRRVRLSSEIARKFFDLQDMLEYDKPSNTLEWLFTKSENAINELARSKHSCTGDAKCFCFSNSDHLQGVDSNDKSLVCAAKERKLKWEEEEDLCVKAKKESREKARARARQRTSSKPRCTALQLQILHQLMPPIQSHEAFVRYPHLVGSEAPRDGFDFVEESIVLKRNLKPSLLSSQHQNLVIPSEASFNNINDYHSLPNSPQNWDTNWDSNGRSDFCGMANMNLSKELQIFGNSWEECTNQRRH